MRWKGILVLFVLVTIFSFYTHVTTIHDNGNDINALYLWYALLLFTLIFGIGINFADRIIKEDKFNKKIIIKFNLLMLLIFTIILEIVLWSIPCQGEGCLTKIFGAPLIPLVLFFATILFSVISSFILFNFDKRIIKSILYMGLILSALFLLLAIVSILTCDFNSRYCLAKKALETGNPYLCEKVRVQTQQNKDLCYLSVSDRWTGNENFCHNIKEERLFNVCIRHLATNTNNPELCNEINSTIAGIGRRECTDWVNVVNSREQLED